MLIRIWGHRSGEGMRTSWSKRHGSQQKGSKRKVRQGSKATGCVGCSKFTGAGKGGSRCGLSAAAGIWPAQPLHAKLCLHNRFCLIKGPSGEKPPRRD